jgi:hypothetical protein
MVLQMCGERGSLVPSEKVQQADAAQLGVAEAAVGLASDGQALGELKPGRYMA